MARIKKKRTRARSYSEKDNEILSDTGSSEPVLTNSDLIDLAGGPNAAYRGDPSGLTSLQKIPGLSTVGRRPEPLLHALVDFDGDLLPGNHVVNGEARLVAILTAAIVENKTSIKKWIGKHRDRGVRVMLVCREGASDVRAICNEIVATIQKARSGCELAENAEGPLRIALYTGHNQRAAMAWLKNTTDLIYAEPAGGEIEPEQQHRDRAVEQIAEEAKESRSESAYMPRLRTLAHSVIDERVSNRHTSTLEEIIRAAQAEEPVGNQDKTAFVKLVNAILDATSHRLRLSDGRLARLCVKPGRKAKGYIQFSPTAGPPTGPFSELKPVTVTPFIHGSKKP